MPTALRSWRGGEEARRQGGEEEEKKKKKKKKKKEEEEARRAILKSKNLTWQVGKNHETRALSQRRGFF